MHQHNNGKVQQAHIQHQTKPGEMQSISTEDMNKARMTAVFISTLYRIEGLASAIRYFKEACWIEIEKEEVKVSLFVDYIISYKNDPEFSTSKH